MERPLRTTLMPEAVMLMPFPVVKTKPWLSRQSIVTDCAIFSGPTVMLGSRQETMPPSVVTESAAPKVLHGAVRLHRLTVFMSSPAPDTQVSESVSARAGVGGNEASNAATVASNSDDFVMIVLLVRQTGSRIMQCRRGEDNRSDADRLASRFRSSRYL